MTGQTLPPATEAGNLYGLTARGFIEMVRDVGPGCGSEQERERGLALHAPGTWLQYLADKHCEQPGESACGGCGECSGGRSAGWPGAFCAGGDWCPDERAHYRDAAAARFEEFHVTYPNVFAHFLADARRHYNAGFTDIPAAHLLRGVAQGIPAEYAPYYAWLARLTSADLWNIFEFRDHGGALVALWGEHQRRFCVKWYAGLFSPEESRGLPWIGAPEMDSMAGQACCWQRGACSTAPPTPERPDSPVLSGLWY